MKKLTQTQQETQKGGEAMNKTQTQQETLYFITFPSKVDQQQAKKVVAELRKHFPSQTGVFMRKPPSGRKMIFHIDGIMVIVTFPYTLKKNEQEQDAKKEQAPKQEQAPRQNPMQGEGFTLGELIKSKKT